MHSQALRIRAFHNITNAKTRIFPWFPTTTRLLVTTTPKYNHRPKSPHIIPDPKAKLEFDNTVAKDLKNNDPDEFFTATNNYLPNNHNDDEKEISAKIKRFYQSQFPFKGITLNSQTLLIKQKDIQELVRQKTYDSVGDLKELIDCNENQVPIIGSIIQYKGPLTNTTNFGMVVRECMSFFNENYNKLVVITTDNEIKSVSPQDIQLHFHGVIDINWINSLKILENRFDDDYYSRSILVNIVKWFINGSIEISSGISNLDILYAQTCHDTELSSISLLEIIQSVQSDPLVADIMAHDYFHQSMVILGIYNELNQNSHQWLLSNNYPQLQGSNIIYNDCSNNLVNPPQIYIIPNNLLISLNTLVQTLNDPNRLKDLNGFIDDFVRQQTSVHKRSLTDLHMFFNLWDGLKFKYFLDSLKFLIIYPNHKLIQQLLKVNCFNHLQSNYVKPGDIIEFLKSTGIFTDDLDIHLSIGLHATPKHISKVSVTRDERFNSKLDSFQCLRDILNKDLFGYLRKGTNQLGVDDTVYVLPIDKEGKGVDVGVSLQKLNSRKYLVKVHVLDLVTKLPPKSKTIRTLLECTSQQAQIKLFNNDINLFDENVLDKFKFNDPENDERVLGESPFDHKTVKEIFDQTRQNLQQSKSLKPTPTPKELVSCMTISFTYNTHEANPFKDIAEKVQVSFDDISNVRFINLTREELNTTISGKRSMLPFSLFKSSRRSFEHDDSTYNSRLKDEDYQNIGFIHGVFKSHFSIRNINGAVNVNEDNNNNSNELHKADFFIQELDKFAANLTSQYCHHYEIPVFNNYHHLLIMPEEYDPNSDEVLVNHDNLLLPHFHSSSFFQTLISRDANGFVSLPAYIIGRNYLNRCKISLNQQDHKNIPNGIDHGYINILNPANNPQAFLNQFQLLSHVHQLYNTQKLLNLQMDEYQQANIEYAMIKKSAHLKGYGYNVNGPLPSYILEKYLSSFTNANRLKRFLSYPQTKYWKLCQLENWLMKNDNEQISFDCIITNTGYRVPNTNVRISKCFVKQMNLEVDIAIDDHNYDFTIGSVIKSNRVIYLDPIEHHCVLEESPSY